MYFFTVLIIIFCSSVLVVVNSNSIQHAAIIIIIIIIIYIFIHCVSEKLCQCYFLNNSVKYWTTLIIFDVQHHEETEQVKLQTSNFVRIFIASIGRKAC